MTIPEMRLGDHNDTCSLALDEGRGNYECDCYAGKMRARALAAEAERDRILAKQDRLFEAIGKGLP